MLGAGASQRGGLGRAARSAAPAPANASRPQNAASGRGAGSCGGQRLGQLRGNVRVHSSGDGPGGGDGSGSGSGFMEGLRKIFDYSSWAPKSSRIWRLQQYQYPEADSYERDPASKPGADDVIDAASVRVLQDRLARMRALGGSPSAGGGGGGETVAGAAAAAGSAGEEGGAERSFSDADDGELSWALGKRISEIAASTGSWGDSVDEADMRRPLTGEEVQQLLMTKYGKLYDMSFAKRSIPGKTFVSLNIMWLHRAQRSFKLTREQYDEKIESVAQLINVLGQTDKVRAFLSSPARSQNGMPPRPVVGTAVSIRLDLSEAQVAEWFGAGYD